MSRDRTAKVTIRDVAAAAGVSVSTVSLALNTPDRVAGATRDRVLRAADELGFVPKAEAVARARHGVGRIGVIGPFSSYAAAGRRLNGVLRAARGTAVEVVVFDQESASASPAPLLAALPRTGRLDGLLVASLPLDDDVVRRLLDLGLPTVLIDVRHRGLSSVHTDDVAGGRIAAEHLLDRGHRRLGFLGEAQRSDDYVSPGRRRLAGFRETLAAAGHPLDPGCVRWTRRDFAAARAEAVALLSGPVPPTGVFAGDDLLAAAVLAARDRVGTGAGELAVVGFDGGDLAEALDLTTVDQPLEESGEAALRMLLQRLARPGPISETVLELTLRARGSTAPRRPPRSPAPVAAIRQAGSMTPEIEAILASGATILVGAAATDAWKATRAGFTRLFGRAGPTQEAATERRLDALVATIDQAGPEHRADIRDQERTRWLVRLSDLIEDDPSAIDDLRSLVEQLAAQLPPQQQAWVQTNIARDNARLFAAQGGGTINVHEGHSSPDA